MNEDDFAASPIKLSRIDEPKRGKGPRSAGEEKPV